VEDDRSARGEGAATSKDVYAPADERTHEAPTRGPSAEAFARALASTMSALAAGDYARRLPLELEGRPLSGELLRATQIVNGTLDRLSHDASEARPPPASSVRSAFLAAASHELRTPLAAAKAQTQLAIRRAEAQHPGFARSLLVIERQIDRMTKLVEDLLDVSRLEAQRLSVERAPVELDALAREVVERLQPISPSHPMWLEASPVVVVGDRDRLEQVLTNLLGNAVRYSPAGGPIEVSVGPQDGGARLAVRDRGVGVPRGLHAHIFERFGRAHGSKYGGLGLGLTITHGIVVEHGGRIEVDSTGVPGEGSVFSVWLPRETPAGR
jgi:signal transduction histidine kinase